MLSGIRSIYLYALSMLALLACESGEVAAPNQSGGQSLLPTWTETGGSVGGCHAAVPSVLGSTNGFTDVCGYRALFFGQQFVPEADQFGLRVGGLYDGQPAWVGIRGLSPPPHYAVSRIACTVVHYGEGGKLTIVLRDSAGAVVESREVVAGGEVIFEGSGLGSLEFVDSLTPGPLGHADWHFLVRKRAFPTRLHSPC
jgi:hypothetical protein